MEKKVNNPSLQKYEVNEKGNTKKKITIDVDEDDPCLKRKGDLPPREREFKFSPASDPRFQQQNQSPRCFVMYTDFYRCQHILGKDHEACTYFKDVFTSICPRFWLERWDELRVTGRLPWHKYRAQGEFPGTKYGD